MFNPKKKIIVEIDISRIALSAILSQLDKENRLYPITFYSRKFTILELNYNIHDKELLVIINSFKVQKVYLEKPKDKIKIRVTVGQSFN